MVGQVGREGLQRQLDVIFHNFTAGFLCFLETDAAPATFHQWNSGLPRRLPPLGAASGRVGQPCRRQCGRLAGLACVALITAALILCLSYERKGNVCRKSKTPRVDALFPYPSRPHARVVLWRAGVQPHTPAATTLYVRPV